jgi:plastocyanin
MMRPYPIALMVGIFALQIGGLPSPTPWPAGDEGPQGSPAAERLVDIRGFLYVPANITVVVGTNVTWENFDSDSHTVTSIAQPRTFDSGCLGEGCQGGQGRWNHSFDVVGNHSYFCSFHPWMEGRVVVYGSAEEFRAPRAEAQAHTSGRSVSFSAMGSGDPDGSIVGYHWDLGDGTTASGPMVEHTYPAPGSYTVHLIVTDDVGLTDGITLEVTVADPIPSIPLAIGGIAVAGAVMATILWVRRRRGPPAGKD